MTIKPQHTINELIETNRLWVKNTSKPRRVLVLTIVDQAGRVTSELVPDTTHPISLSDLIPRQALLNCRDLFKFVQTGVLEVIEPDKAAAYYQARPEAKQAVIRAFEKVSPRTASSVDDGSSTTKKIVTDSDVIGTKTDVSGVNMRVRALLDTLPVTTGNAKKDAEVNQGRTGTIDNVLLDLDNLELTDADIQYMMAHSNPRVREYAQKVQAAA